MGPSRSCGRRSAGKQLEAGKAGGKDIIKQDSRQPTGRSLFLEFLTSWLADFVAKRRFRVGFAVKFFGNSTFPGLARITTLLNSSPPAIICNNYSRFHFALLERTLACTAVEHRECITAHAWWTLCMINITPIPFVFVCYRQWRVVSLDGRTLQGADTEANRLYLGRPGASRGQSAWPWVGGERYSQHLWSQRRAL